MVKYYHFLATLSFFGMSLAASAQESTATCDVREVGSKQQMESGDLLAAIEVRRQWLQRDPDSNRKSNISKKLHDLELEVKEQQAREQAAGVFYCRRNSINAQDFIADIGAKVEHCGFTNFPKKNGKPIYGSGAVQFTIDGWGKLIEASIDRSSGDTLIDEHMLKIIGASAPFGDVPISLLARDYKRIRFTLAFHFENSKKSKPSKAPKEKCVLRS